MGQAKLKGSFEQRQAQAMSRVRSRFPASIKCNHCSNDLADIQAMDVRGIPEMRLAGAALCDVCSSTTWVLDGTPKALAEFQDFMSSQHGEKVQVGVAQRPKP